MIYGILVAKRRTETLKKLNLFCYVHSFHHIVKGQGKDILQ